ncbi:redoxin domain-containing protein [Alicyclobacillus sp. SO9]|uniref:redoxin domain-containing protein n=1 Tax=Alicyclobacillus sp. SO9 TaxID=2665646 RepID=UPI0018E7E0CD|nr:redoxin domain-containing protein [Alicyclobacillus sp. SO9]QQE78462.1 redoxin domain-containing protein [Alicyclobacillus sp. SO9]
MKRSTQRLRDGVIAVAVVAVVLGGGVAAWKTVTHLGNPRSGVGTVSSAKASKSSSNTSSPSVDSGSSLSGKKAPNFHLTNQFGQPGSLSEFRHKVVVLSFIDSKGTTVCPLTAVVMQNVRYDLGSAASEVAFVGVNANPVASSVKDVHTWSQQHHVLHMWNYFTGSASQLKSVYQKYFIESKVIHGTDIQHTPAVYVIGPDGHEKWLYLNSTKASTSVIGTETRDLLKQVVPLIPGHPSVNIPPTRKLAYLPGKVGPKESKSRPFHLLAILPGGKNGSISVGGGGGPKLLEFFATWCPDCEEEIPALLKSEKWSKNHKNFPSVVGVDLRLSEPSTKHVVNYVKKFKLSFPVALDNQDKVAEKYGVNGIPTQVLVSSSGHILWYHQGLLKWKSLKTDVDKALQGNQ